MENDKNWIEKYSTNANRTASHCFKLYGRIMQIQLEEDNGTIIHLTEEHSQDIIHGILGMIGEEGEVMEEIKKVENESIYEKMTQEFSAPVLKEGIRKEIGDMMWYANRIAMGLGVTLTEVMEGGKEEMIPSTTKMAENLKKWLFYGKRMNKKEMIQLLKNGIQQAKGLFGHGYKDKDEDPMHLIFKENIEKLKKRFPERFTETDAIARVDV